MTRQDLAPVAAFRGAERRLLAGMMSRSVNSPVTSSAGRLFDGVAALLGLCQRSSFEGQAAMRLEFAADPDVFDSYPFDFDPPVDGSDAPAIVDWRPTIEALVLDVGRGISPAVASARFHGTLVEMIARVVEHTGEKTVALTGGCFQNRLLAERVVRRLRQNGIEVLLHRQVPPNDGGISLGQVAVAAAREQIETTDHKADLDGSRAGCS